MGAVFANPEHLRDAAAEIEGIVASQIEMPLAAPTPMHRCVDPAVADVLFAAGEVANSVDRQIGKMATAIVEVAQSVVAADGDMPRSCEPATPAVPPSAMI